MSTTKDTPKKIHQGRNVKRFREMMGLKQELLADRLGADWSQKKISMIESSEVIEPVLLEQLAAALKVSADAIKDFDEEKAVYNIQNNYDNANPSINFPYQCTFNPLDKYIEEVENNKKLVEDIKKLYESLLKNEREKNALLEKILSDKKK